MVDILKYETVDGDLTDITGRLKEIDPSYFVLRERKSGKLQLHSSAQRGSTLALSLPYRVLDCRTLELARRTRSERAEAEAAETERHNAVLERERKNALVKKAEKLWESAIKAEEKKDAR